MTEQNNANNNRGLVPPNIPPKPGSGVVPPSIPIKPPSSPPQNQQNNNESDSSK